MIGGGATRAEKRFAASVKLAADKLRAGIVAGQWKSGAHLPEPVLIAELKVGAIVLREALCTLEAEGYVTTAPDDRATVSKPTRREIEDAYAIAGALEGLAARLAVARARPEEIERLRELHLLLKDASHRRDLDRYFDANASFHRFIAQLAGNQRLAHMIEGLRREIQKTRVLALGAAERLEYSMREHDQILDTFLKRNAELAETTMIRHMNNHKETLLKALALAEGAIDESTHGQKGARLGY